MRKSSLCPMPRRVWVIVMSFASEQAMGVKGDEFDFFKQSLIVWRIGHDMT